MLGLKQDNEQIPQLPYKLSGVGTYLASLLTSDPSWSEFYPFWTRFSILFFFVVVRIRNVRTTRRWLILFRMITINLARGTMHMYSALCIIVAHCIYISIQCYRFTKNIFQLTRPMDIRTFHFQFPRLTTALISSATSVMCSRVWLPCETRDHSLLWVNNTKYVDTRLQLACVFFFQISCCSFSRIPRYSALSKMWWTTTERWQTSPSLATIQSMEQRVCLSHAHTAWIAFGLQLSISLFLFPSLFNTVRFLLSCSEQHEIRNSIFLAHALLTVVL